MSAGVLEFESQLYSVRARAPGGRGAGEQRPLPRHLPLLTSSTARLPVAQAGVRGIFL